MSTNKPDIVVLGTIVFDLFVKGVSSFPMKGRAIQIEKFPYSIGGCGANSAIVLSQLGAKVSLIGSIGQDHFGDYVKEKLVESNLSLELISIREKLSTSISILFIGKSGERSYLHGSGANEKINLTDKALFQISSAKIFHIGGAMLIPGFDGKPMAKVLKFAKKNKTLTSVDLGWDTSNNWMKKLEPSLAFIDILMMNEAELKALTRKRKIESSVNYLHDKGPKVIVIKLGVKGAFISKDILKVHVPAIKTKVVDTTAAGDSFAAGFLFSLVNGGNLIDSVKLGNTLGALTVQKFGSLTDTIDLKSVMKFAKRHYDFNSLS